MVQHNILWKIKEDKTEEEKKQIKQQVKEGLEGLYGVIPGLTKIHVQIDCLPSSTADLMLESTFENEAALKAYAVHEAHVKVADSVVRPNMEVRMCLDYEV
ncbi:MAG: Dabb family protein [Lachnospiraceae bacterium]|nr:Dabb family protein [Lachnospiraceae bacterium]MEE1342678.1 Dabb family protein [Lachnospiraceae bacterium]